MIEEIRLVQYENGEEKVLYAAPAASAGSPWGTFEVSEKRLQAPGILQGRRLTVEFSADQSLDNVSLVVAFHDSVWKRADYLMVPAAVYDGNRFRIRKLPYPPMFRQEDYDMNPPVTVTDIPHLAKSGEDGTISLRAGDSALPAAFVYHREEQKGFAFLYPSNPMGDGRSESGCVIDESREGLSLAIMEPVVRARGMYRFGNIRSDAPCEDTAALVRKGDTLRLCVDCYEFTCGSVAALYQQALVLSHLPEPVAGPRSLPDQVPLSYAFSLIENKYNAWNWNTQHRFYCVGENEGLYSCWQTGWVGGINAAYSLYCDGSEETQRRAISTMDFMFRVMQAPTGFFYAVSDGEHIYGDDFRNIQDRGVCLVRKNADALYFSACILLEMRKRGRQPEKCWEQGLRRCAEAFCRLFQREGQLGQFINVDTQQILVGASASGGMVPAGLALCSLYFDEPLYLKAAEEMAEYFYENYTQIGLANGGPGEILSAPDSESAYALVESDVLLYECTRSKRYLDWALEAANIYATWCMPYDYPFPAQSMFGQADMRSTGAVWANVQNKHGAPGPCTHSGSALFRLARYTGKLTYMEMCRDTSHNITQYLSRDDRPLWDYAHVKKAPSGFICERVSTCDWEGFEKIGGIYASGCWCEATALCIYTDFPGIWVDMEHQRIWQCDHVRAQIQGSMLTLSNETSYDARVRLFIDHGEWERGDFDYRSSMQTVPVGAGESLQLELL